ncbi:hypothetical protein ACLOJK_001559 [Asimina triloba]
MGVPATHVFHPTTAGPITTVPALITKPAAMAPSTGNSSSSEEFDRESTLVICSSTLGFAISHLHE